MAKVTGGADNVTFAYDAGVWYKDPAVVSHGFLSADHRSPFYASNELATNRIDEGFDIWDLF